MIIKRHGFTLVEILITVLILAVLAGLALPTFFGAVEKSRGNEAITNLNIIWMGEKIYRLNNPSFWGPGVTNIPQVNTALSTDMSATYFGIGTGPISITLSNGGNTYTAVLTRNNVSGGNGTDWYQHVYTNGAGGVPACTKTGGGAC